MRRRGFGSLKYAIVGCLAVVVPHGSVCAQPKKVTTPENNILASKVECQDFQKNSDGTWTSGPNTKIGIMDFSSHIFGTGDVDIGGADLATVLNRKCGDR
jgi:hypothetical protein